MASAFDYTTLGQSAKRTWAGSETYQPVSYTEQAYGGLDSEQLRKRLNLTSPGKNSYYNHFDRLYSVYPEYELSSLRQYVFFTRPDLNIVGGSASATQVSSTCKNNQLIRDTCLRRPYIARQLTDTLSYSHDLIPFLVGRTESLQIPDYSLKTYSISQPYTNYLMPYAGTAIESQTGGVFEVTFREDAEMNVSRLFQVYTTYIDGIKRNLFKPKKKYIDFNKFDYMISAYYIVCAPDGSKILWFAKYTGAFPISVPNSNLSFNLRGGVESKISIPFSYFMHESLDPEILVDFNQNSSGSIRGTADFYDPYMGGSSSGIVGAPYISTEKNEYFLEWREYET